MLAIFDTRDIDSPDVGQPTGPEVIKYIKKYCVQNNGNYGAM